MDYKWEFIDEEGREEIFAWSLERKEKYKGYGKSLSSFLVYTFTYKTIKSFIQNFNFMVLMQMSLAGASVYVFTYFGIYYDLHIGLFVSPIVFPLAFSINIDFQRREKVLEDLAAFKSSSMVWFFCMRDWKLPSGLDEEWMKATQQKLKSILFHLREYLLTDTIDRRKVILKAMYEDFSDTNQLIEKVRASKLPANPAIISRLVHLLNTMVLSFERLRVIREYRSPRSIRSLNKVLIFFLPIVLAPYLIHLGMNTNNSWSPYVLSISCSFIFSALQGVQDKLDDPFDGFSEDDIDIETLDEWTEQSLEITANRIFTVGRFKALVIAETFIESIKKKSTTLNDEMSDIEIKVGAVKNCAVKNQNKKDSSIEKIKNRFLERPENLLKDKKVNSVIVDAHKNQMVAIAVYQEKPFH